MSVIETSSIPMVWLTGGAGTLAELVLAKNSAIPAIAIDTRIVFCILFILSPIRHHSQSTMHNRNVVNLGLGRTA
jgi:hypothetical protein